MTVFTNADFISFDESENIYSVMVVGGKNIVYIGYNIPLCYRDEKIIDLGGKAVVPTINSIVFADCKKASCSALKEGESADFIVLDKNPLKSPDPGIVDIYIKGKKKNLNKVL